MIAVNKNQSAAVQQPCKRRSEVVKVETSSAKSLVSRPHPEQRKISLLLHKLASLLRHLESFLWFACEVWPSTGRGVVRALQIRSQV